MSELLRLDSGEGGTVLVEVADDSGGPVTRGGRARTAVLDAGESLERVVGQLGPVVKGIVSELQAAADWPDEIEIEFAIKVSADANLIIARTGGETNFRITLRRSRPPASG